MHETKAEKEEKETKRQNQGSKIKQKRKKRRKTTKNKRETEKEKVKRGEDKDSGETKGDTEKLTKMPFLGGKQAFLFKAKERKTKQGGKNKKIRRV